MPLSPQNPEHSDPFASTGYYPVMGAAPGQVTPAAQRDAAHSDVVADKLLYKMNEKPMAVDGSSPTNGVNSEAMYNVKAKDIQDPNPRKGFTAGEINNRLQITQQEQHSLVQFAGSVEERVNRLAYQGDNAPTPMHAQVEDDGRANLFSMPQALAERIAKLGGIPNSGLPAGTSPARTPVHSDPTLDVGYKEVRPTGPANLTATITRNEAADSIINLNWDDAAASESVVGWVIYQKVGGNMVPMVVSHTYPTGAPNTTPNRLLDRVRIVTASAYSFTNNTAGDYTYGVVAFDSYGHMSVVTTVDVTVDRTAPAIPAKPTFTIAAGMKAKADWVAVAGTPAKYDIAVYKASDNSVVDSGTVNVPTVTWTGTVVLTQAVNYYVKVRAKDAQENASAYSVASDQDYWDTTAPVWPADTTATLVAAGGKGKVDWSAAATDNKGVAKYKLAILDVNNAVLDSNDNVAADVLTWTGTVNLVQGTTYKATVIAVDVKTNESVPLTSVNYIAP